jgi:hypothetical protein
MHFLLTLSTAEITYRQWQMNEYGALVEKQLTREAWIVIDKPAPLHTSFTSPTWTGIRPRLSRRLTAWTVVRHRYDDELRSALNIHDIKLCTGYGSAADRNVWTEQTVAFIQLPVKRGYFDQLMENLFAPWHLLLVLVALWDVCSE